MRETIAILRRRLAALAPAAPQAGSRFALGHAGIDGHLGSGLARAALHEICAAHSGDAAAAAGFALALARRAAGRRKIVWVRHGLATMEAGEAYAPGVLDLGLDPGDLLMVVPRDPLAALRAAHEAVRCNALGAVLIELWGEVAALDLAASRRLMLAAGRSCVPALLLRAGGGAAPSAALSRWSVQAAASAPLAAGTPGHAAFDLALERHRAGIPPARWRVEWNRDACCFIDPAPLSGRVAAEPGDRPAASPGTADPLRRAG